MSTGKISQFIKNIFLLSLSNTYEKRYLKLCRRNIILFQTFSLKETLPNLSIKQKTYTGRNKDGIDLEDLSLTYFPSATRWDKCYCKRNSSLIFYDFEPCQCKNSCVESIVHCTIVIQILLAITKLWLDLKCVPQDKSHTLH